MVTQPVLFALLGAVIASAVIWGLQDTKQPALATVEFPATTADTQKDESTSIEELQQTINQLQQQLKLEQDNSAALDYELQLLEDLLADANSPTPMKKPSRPGETWFDENRLLALDIDPNEIETIKALHNQAELEKLSLRNRTARDPKLRRSLYRELKRIDAELRNALGEENYDRMLYGSGKNNRVEVTDVLKGSEANTIGIQKGDLIISYGGERIYEPTNLYQNTAKGEIGETTAVEIQRGEDILTVYVPRGPLGTRFKPITQKPK